MKPYSISASSLDRTAVCPASAALPAARSTTAYAARGTVIHGFLARVQEVGRDEALAEIDDEWREACERIDVEHLPVSGDCAAEVGFAFDIVTGAARELGRNLTHRDYASLGLRDTEIAGTADVVGVGDGEAYAADFKTGWVDIPRAASSRQLRFYALCTARAYGVDRVTVEVIRVREDDEPYVDRATFEGFDLAMFAGELEDIVRRVAAAREKVARKELPTVTEGAHCRFCRALYSCPAKNSLALSIGELRRLESIEDLFGEVSLQTAGQVYLKLQAVEQLVKIGKERIYELARSRPIPLGQGRYLGQHTKPGNERLDGDGTYQTIRALAGDEIAELAAPATRTATKKNLKDALRALRDAGAIKKMAPVEREWLATLRDQGCATKPNVTKVREFEAPECRNERCVERAMTEGGTCDLCAIDLEMGGAGVGGA